MSGQRTSASSAEVVSRLVKRGHLLSRIRSGTADRRVLARELDESRTTVYRGLDQLEDLGLLVQSNGVYAPTRYGQLVHAAFERADETIRTLSAARDVLESLPDDSPIDLDPVRGATILTPDRAEPTGLIDRIESLVGSATRLTALLPVLHPRYMDAIDARLSAGPLEADLVVEAPGVEVIRRKYVGPLGEAVVSGSLRVRSTPDRLPFGLVVVGAPEPRMQILPHDPHGNLRGIVENDTTPAMDWAETTAGGYAERATPVDLPRPPGE